MKHWANSDENPLSFSDQKVPQVIPMDEEDDEWYVKIKDSHEDESVNRSMKELTLTYTNSETDQSQDLKSEYVGFDARKHGCYQTTEEDEPELPKEIFPQSSYIYSSAWKLEDDEVTLMKVSNETLKQQPSEDFTGINESESYDKSGRFSTQFEVYERENSSRLREFEKCKDAINDTSRPTLTSPSRIVKVSWLSILGGESSFKRSAFYKSESMSPGSKFQQSQRKITPNHVEQFLLQKHKNSNSWDKINHINIKEKASKVFDFKYKPKNKKKVFNFTASKPAPNIRSSKPWKISFISSQESEDKENHQFNNMNTKVSNNENWLNLLPSEGTDGGEENIKERLSDVYSTRNNVSVRQPKVIRTLAEKGVTQSRNFDSSGYISISDNCHTENKTSFTGSDFGSFLTTKHGQKPTYKREVDSRTYFSEFSKNKENFEHQNIDQSITQTDYCLNFGPKASQTVSWIFEYALINI